MQTLRFEPATIQHHFTWFSFLASDLPLSGKVGPQKVHYYKKIAIVRPKYLFNAIILLQESTWSFFILCIHAHEIFVELVSSTTTTTTTTKASQKARLSRYEEKQRKKGFCCWQGSSINSVCSICDCEA